MPLIAIAIVLAIYFIPLAIGEKVLVGFILGSLGKAAFPYYRKWKDGEEDLIFNYAYLMPVVIAIGVTTLSYLSGFMLYVIPANAPVWLAYGGAVVFGFGGAEMLTELMKYWDFFHQLWEYQTDLVDEVLIDYNEALDEAYTAVDDEDYEPLDEEEPEPEPDVEIEETEELIL